MTIKVIIFSSTYLQYHRALARCAIFLFHPTPVKVICWGCLFSFTKFGYIKAGKSFENDVLVLRIAPPRLNGQAGKTLPKKRYFVDCVL